MLLALAVVLALGIGVAVGGHPLNLARLQLKGWPLLLVAVGVQAYFAGRTTPDVWGTIPLRAGAFVATHALVLAVVAINYRQAGLKMAGLGAALNLLALLANGGLMPVSPQARVLIGHQAAVNSLDLGAAVVGSKGVVLFPEEAHLWLLTDIFALPPPFPLPAVFSLGDLLVAVGLGYLILHTLRASCPHE